MTAGSGSPDGSSSDVGAEMSSMTDQISLLAERGFVLERIDGVLSLRDLRDSSMQPLSVDFSSPQLLHRLKTSGKNQPLAKAIGLASFAAARADLAGSYAGAADSGAEVKAARPFVFDATAGLGTDALVLASLGCRVRSIERSETIFTLLQDGHARLRQVEPELAARMTFEHADARTILASLARASGAPDVSDGIAPDVNEGRASVRERKMPDVSDGMTHDMSPTVALGNLRPDVVYLDPMYPEEGRSKSALPKKTMQMFRRLLDGDEDANELWEAAMKVALKRVVVKRPLHAPSLGTKKPNHSFEGKTARFDLYLVGR